MPCLIGAGGAVPADRHAAVSTKYFWLSLLAIPFWFSSLLYFLTILLFAPEDLTILHDRFYQSQLGIFFSNAVIIFHHNLSICVGLPSSEPRRPVRS
jgi:hypothetical protein